MLLSSKVSFAFFLLKLSYAGPSLIQFCLKGNNRSKSVFKRVFKVVSSQLLQEICIKSENVIFMRLSFQKNGVI